MSKKNKPILTSKRFNKTDGVQQYILLVKCMGKPDACAMSTYQRHENIFGKNGSCMKKEIKKTNDGCVYCNISICKRTF